MQSNNFDKDLVTVATVTYNAEDLLEETILSVTNQNYENKINYWISEPDKGIYYAMNKS